MPALLVTGFVLFLFACQTQASPVNLSHDEQRTEEHVYNFTGSLVVGNDRRGNGFVLDNRKFEDLMVNLISTLWELIQNWNGTFIDSEKIELPSESVQETGGKRATRIKRTLMGMERWNSMMDPFLEFGAALMGSFAVKDACVDRLVCLATTFMPSFPGRNIVLVLLESMVPTNWNPYFKGAKASLLMSENCQRYPCFSGLL